MPSRKKWKSSGWSSTRFLLLYVNGSTQRAREYSSNFASIDAIASSKGNSQANAVGFLCSYFCFDSNGTLGEEPQTSTYIDVDNYRATILSPNI